MQDNGAVVDVLVGSKTTLSNGTPRPVQFCLGAVNGEYFFTDRWERSEGEVQVLAQRSARRLGHALVLAGIRHCRLINGQRLCRKTREVVVAEPFDQMLTAYICEGLRATGLRIEAVQRAAAQTKREERLKRR